MTDRGETHETHSEGTSEGRLRRRGMLVAVAALAAGGLAKATTTPALAGTDGDLVLNALNTTTGQTGIFLQAGANPGLAWVASALPGAGNNDGMRGYASGNGTGVFSQGGSLGGYGVSAAGGTSGTAGAGGTGLVAAGGTGTAGNANGGIGVDAFGGDRAGTGTNGIGVRGTGASTGAGTGASGVVGLTSSSANPAVSGQNSGAGDGVFGNSSSGIGVHGNSNAQTAVYGNTGSGVGARGDATSGTGVIGTSATNNGVFGLSPGAGNGVVGQSGNGNGVLGQATSGGNGVQGLTTSGVGVFGSGGSGTGVFGTSVSGAGVAGTSANNNGVFGDASAAGNGVFARTASGNGLVAQATGSGNAATFFGSVIVNGNFTVGPAFVKSGSVAFTDGSVRRLYATEAPESWFEDVGEAQLVNGRANVPIPPDFLQAVNTAVPYYVFPVAHTADIESLAVTVRAPDHFEVQANGKGVVEGTFGYRIMAKRKDLAGPRFERVTLPAAPTTTALDAVVHAPVAPVPVKLPDLPAGAQEIRPVQPPPTPSTVRSREAQP
jgi:hypothetical protein